ncbi:MAG: DUF1345 domain-containing protein [Caulobacteraceae bacterium]|nr:DUF1345 domain-containing protein [Caulobacteraceae bacterium]
MSDLSPSGVTPRKRRMPPHHWRLGVGAVTGVVALVLSTLADAPAPARSLIAWNAGAAVYLILTWRLFLIADAADVRCRASFEDETPWGLLVLVIGAIISSLVGIVFALMESKHGGETVQNLVSALAVLTLIVSWVMLQTVFVLHYAHRYFGDSNGDGEINGGFKFAGDPPESYMDFVYLSFCMGATFQVSDTNVERAPLRNLITAHGAIAYFYNTTILALGINILSGLVGH